MTVEDELANCGTVVVRPVSDARYRVVWKDCSGGGEDSSSRPRNLRAKCKLRHLLFIIDVANEMQCLKTGICYSLLLLHFALLLVRYTVDVV